MKKESGTIIYSPSDLIRYLRSPFASWMYRYELENPGAITPDEESEEEKLFSTAGGEHERTILANFKTSEPNLVEISREDIAGAKARTLTAIRDKAPIIFQAALEDGVFAGFTDFLKLDQSGKYQVWDTKLARSPKPYYPIQLCCYSEMLAAVTGEVLAEKIGVILGNRDRLEFRVEDFIHYYRHIKNTFIAMQDRFSGKLTDRPEPLPGAEHGRWTSYAEKFFIEKDHLVQVAGISVGQIKKLKTAGVTTMAGLAAAAATSVHKLDAGTLEKLVAQARLQCLTRDDRKTNPDAKPHYERLRHKGPNGEPLGLATLPPGDPADVFFDMEGFPDPLVAGGLEYLFGTWSRNDLLGPFEFRDWWAHDRGEEKLAFEGFIDWVSDRWKKNPAMHIYHYATYEVSAVRRLSTRHDTRQEEVDELLRNNVFVDLYKIVRHGLRIGEDNYSLKVIELLYRSKRATDVVSAADSMVQYGNWMQSGQSRDWKSSSILKGLRDYNEDDCKSTSELTDWLRKVATDQGVSFSAGILESAKARPKPAAPEIAARQELAAKLRAQGYLVSLVLADVVDFHRRELKPMWWRMFDRADATEEELRDDSGCIEGVKAVGPCVAEKKSFLQKYTFDPSQECKLAADDRVMFTHNLDASFAVAAIDLDRGELTLKIGKKGLDDKCQGVFPTSGSLLKNEYIAPGEIPGALSDIGEDQLSNRLVPSIKSFLERLAPANPLQQPAESPLDAALRIIKSMAGGCLVIQGPPGTGKTYTASCMIETLLAAGKKVGVASNSHKAVVNLLCECGNIARKNGRALSGIKVGDDPADPVFLANPGLVHVQDTGKARDAYWGGIVGGTAWLFSRPEWKGTLDFLYIDEAGQVPLANAMAMTRSANNLVLLGDQMQLEQPVQGAHPGDAGLSALQYALKDTEKSENDAPVFQAVIPAELGLFLGESRRMHPNVCRFISESIYESRLDSIPECANQKIEIPASGSALVTIESGIVFSGIEHDGDIQQSDEEVVRVRSIYNELLGRAYTNKDGKTKPLELSDLLFIAPYNAQVRALKAALPKGARVGSVDKFQGQEAAVCVLSLCSSFGEYGSRGLRFILDRSRINVAISRAKCLAVVVGDPRIACTSAGSINEMMLLNLYCKLTT
jgi:predicted RecB family nuclease